MKVGSDHGGVWLAETFGSLLSKAWAAIAGVKMRPVLQPMPGGFAGRPINIALATLTNDVDGAWTRALASQFEGKAGLAAQVLPINLPGIVGDEQAKVNIAQHRARQVLAKEAVFDLLIWGDVHEEGYSLWFTSAAINDDERIGGFSPYGHLELTGTQESPSDDVLALASLTATEPLTEEQRLLHRLLLKTQFVKLTDFPANVPVAWSLDQQRDALAMWGHAASIIAAIEGDVDLCQRAADAYIAAINRLGPNEHGSEEAGLRRHLAAIQLVQGEKTRGVPVIEQAVENCRIAVQCLSLAVQPLEWANAQNRLGLALSRLDLLTGRAELLKEAMAAFQAAAQVLTRAHSPQRWGEVMNNLAQALQLYGDQMKNPSVLERAIETCRLALEVRTRERAPLAWAVSQNCLGSALFLLGKHSQSTEPLDEAAVAFQSASEVYRALGATRPALVADKNLAHVKRLMKIKGVRRVAMPDWADDSE
jgi:tetratricopeptide (TPR) repeat protein